MSNYEQNPPTQGPPSGDGQMTPQQFQRYQFSQEEMRVIKECQRESFYSRSLPLGIGLTTFTYWAVKAGYLKANPRWGAFPKAAAAMFIGYIFGKASYQSICMEKLMQLDTPLAEQLRRQKGRGSLQNAISFGAETAFPSIGVPDEPNTARDTGRMSSDVMDIRPMSNFDTEHSIFGGTDYKNKPLDSTAEMLNDDNLPPRAPPNYATSYDDLRRKNRMEYEAQRYAVQPPAAQRPPPQPAPEAYRPAPPRETGPRKIKNQYGDVWDDVPQN